MTNKELNQIIKGCISNNLKAKETLYKHFAREMMYVCRKYSASNEDAKDLHQECFIKAFEKIKTYNEEGCFEGWLKRIFINHSINHYQKQKNQFFVSIPDNGDFNDSLEETMEYDEDTSFNCALDNYTFDEILILIDELTYPGNLVFKLYYLEEQSHTDIASILNISVSNSKIILHRAKKKLYNNIISKQLSVAV